MLLCEDPDTQVGYRDIDGEDSEEFSSLTTREGGQNAIRFQVRRQDIDDLGGGAISNQSIITGPVGNPDDLPYFIPLCFNDPNNLAHPVPLIEPDFHGMGTARSFYPPDPTDPDAPVIPNPIPPHYISTFEKAHFDDNYVINEPIYPTVFTLSAENMKLEGFEEDGDNDDNDLEIFQANTFPNNNGRKLYLATTQYFPKLLVHGHPEYDPEYELKAKRRRSGDRADVYRNIKETYVELVYDDERGHYVVWEVIEYDNGDPDRRLLWIADTGNTAGGNNHDPGDLRRLEDYHEAVFLNDGDAIMILI